MERNWEVHVLKYEQIVFMVLSDESKSVKEKKMKEKKNKEVKKKRSPLIRKWDKKGNSERKLKIFFYLKSYKTLTEENKKEML